MTSKGGTPGVTSARTAASVDPRFRSPRATVRTFLIAMNLTEDDPHRIDEAVACLDLSGIPPDRRDGGRLAFELEFILRSTNIPTVVIPDAVDGPDCTIGENKDVKLTLHRMADGRWLFDSKTLQDLPRMRLFLWQRALAAGQGKEAGDVPADFRSPYAMFHTFIDAFKKGDLDAAARCLDLTDDPRPGPPDRREGAGLQAQGGPRPDHLRHLPGPPGLLGRRPAGGAGPQGGADHRGAAGRGQAQGAVALQPGHGPVARSALRRVRVEAHRPRAGRDRADGRACPSSGSRPGCGFVIGFPTGSGIGSDLAGRFSFAVYQLLGMGLLVLLVVPAYRLVVWPLARLIRSLMRRRGVATDDREVASWVRPVGWLAVVWMLVEGVTILDLRMEAAGALLAVLVPAFWLAAAFAAYQLIDPILKLIAGPAVTQEGATTLAAMGLPGALAGAQDPGGRLRAGGACSSCSTSTSGPSSPAWGSAAWRSPWPRRTRSRTSSAR